MCSISQFLQYDTDFGIELPFREYLAPSLVRKCYLISMH